MPPWNRKRELPDGENPQPQGWVPPWTAGALHDAYEALLGAVWEAEANWRFDDRLDMQLKTRLPGTKG